jgi:antitoxin ParD1/3/4
VGTPPVDITDGGVRRLANSCQSGNNNPMPTKNVNLSPQQADFVQRSIRAGQYRNASEVVRAGLRMLEHQSHQDKLKIDALRRVANSAFEQFDKGEFVTVDPKDLKEFIDGLGSRSRKSKRS